MTIKKNDFIEIEFTGKYDENVFDTTNPEQAKEIGMENANVKPIVVCVGHDMVLKGLDEELIGKEVGKEYTAHLVPEKAFGKRNPQLVKLMPMRVFREKNINPMPGMALQLDAHVVKIISVSGGRVMVDFNNPLAGKEVDYTFKITKEVTDDKEKVNALQDYFFRKRFDFKITDNKKVVFSDESVKPFIEMLGKKFEEMTGLKFTIEKKDLEEKISKEAEKSVEKTNISK
jgi:FKBP-type peptidyl-prolyl cis-trans isomerase 2